MFMNYYAPNRCEPSIEALNFFFFFFFFFFGGGGGGDQGRCERRSEVFVKFQKKKYFFFFGGGRGEGRGQGKHEQRSEVFVKIQKKIWREGVRMDVNEELKFL